ncbi:MAG TPA: lipopolysaccharide heptosyltransferase II [Verrucomicrobiae bacterium]|nr:lipopolysaccharide heptosyltransferase II [Verrucomicrobiae bacterium]
MPSRSPPAALQPRRILVRGVNWLGDAVMTTPALLRLREHFPDALIAILTPEKLRGLWLHHPAIDEVISFKSDEGPWRVARKIRVVMWPDTEGKPTVAASAKRAAGAIHPLQRGAFDLALVLPNSPRSALETWLARIPRRLGYARPWRNFFLTTAVPSRPDATHMRKRSVAEIEKLVAADSAANVSRFTFHASSHQLHDYLHLVAALGANPAPLPPQLVVTPGEIKAAAQKFNLTDQFIKNRPLFGLNPGAEYGPAKRWPAERFVAVAREIQKRTNCLWLILGGRGDSQLAGEIESALSAGVSPPVNLAGKTSLRELCAVIKQCRVLLTNDTGPMHIAAALGTPVVVPFGSTSPELTGPILSAGTRHQLIKSDAPCSPCFLRECPIDFRCMNGITVERVVEAVLKSVL